MVDMTALDELLADYDALRTGECEANTAERDALVRRVRGTAKWQKAPPAETGYYWLAIPKAMPFVVWVENGQMGNIGTERCVPVADLAGGLWYGPIEAPGGYL
jgi:hypothetical protein